MNYKETLFFVAKCLTITLEKENRKEIEAQLKSTEIDWDAVVKLSTEHYVFPALYCNLKRADFLKHLPEELVNYMIHITDLNRERNLQIIEQAKEVNELLLDNNIAPIFLKGTGNLLEGLYEDIAERMVGDIDFIVSKDDYLKTIKIIKKDNYVKTHPERDAFPSHRHYFRLSKEHKIAAVEIHKELLIKKYISEFNFSVIKQDSQIINNASVLSFANQLALSIIAKQINDNGQLFKNISLRNGYDVFLLSKKTSLIKALSNFKELLTPLNNFAAICYTTFGNTSSLKYINTEDAKKYLLTYNKHNSNIKVRKKYLQKTKNKIFVKTRVTIIYKSVFNKEYRSWFLKKIINKNWQQEKLSQLGLKKTKS